MMHEIRSIVDICFLFLQGEDFEESSKKLALTAQSLDPSGLYVCDDGFSFIIWLGRMLPSDIVHNILGVDLSVFPDLSKVWFVLYLSPSNIVKELRMALVLIYLEFEVIPPTLSHSFNKINQFVCIKFT